jgi:hypothetical protein
MMMEENLSPKEAEKILGERDPYVGIVLEEVNDKLSIIIEGNDTLELKIDRVDAKLETFRTEVNEKFDAYSEDMKSLRVGKAEKSDISVLERRVTRLEEGRVSGDH